MQRLRNTEKITSVVITDRYDVKNKYTRLAHMKGETYYKRHLFGLFRTKHVAKTDLYYDETIDMREWNCKERTLDYIIQYWDDMGEDFYNSYEIHPISKEVYMKPNITINFTDGGAIHKVFDTNEELEQWWEHICKGYNINMDKFIGY